MKEIQIPEGGAAQLPIDEELQTILLQIANSRAQLLKYQKNIQNRDLYDFLEDKIGRVNDNLVNAISGLSLVLSDRMSCQLIDNQ